MATANHWKQDLAQLAPSQHLVQISHDPETLAEITAYFLKDGVIAEEGVLLIVSSEQRGLIAKHLATIGFDLNVWDRNGQITVLDSAAALTRLRPNGELAWPVFAQVVGGIVRDMQKRHAAIRIYGDMVNILWQAGERTAAIRLEGFWNALNKEIPFVLLCAYLVDNLDPKTYATDFEHMCSTHTHLIPADDYHEMEVSLKYAEDKVLGAKLPATLARLAQANAHNTAMPPAQAEIIYLNQTLPRIAEKVMAQMRLLRDSKPAAAS